jgi:hypothetical protein
MQDQLAVAAGCDDVQAMPGGDGDRSRVNCAALHAAGAGAFACGLVLASYGQASSSGIPMIARGN